MAQALAQAVLPGIYSGIDSIGCPCELAIQNIEVLPLEPKALRPLLQYLRIGISLDGKNTLHIHGTEVTLYSPPLPEFPADHVFGTHFVGGLGQFGPVTPITVINLGVSADGRPEYFAYVKTVTSIFGTRTLDRKLCSQLRWSHRN